MTIADINSVNSLNSGSKQVSKITEEFDISTVKYSQEKHSSLDSTRTGL